MSESLLTFCLGWLLGLVTGMGVMVEIVHRRKR